MLEISLLSPLFDGYINELSPRYEENDPQRLPGDGKQEQGDSWAEGDEGAAEKHRRRHFGSSWGDSAASSALSCYLRADLLIFVFKLR